MPQNDRPRNDFAEFNSLADRLRLKTIENEDIVTRLLNFYNRTLEFMKSYSPFHECLISVKDLISSLDGPDWDSSYPRQWFLLSENGRRHILNYASSWGVILEKPRPVTALAVQRLHEFYVNGDPRAVAIVDTYQQKAKAVDDENVRRMMAILTNTARAEISKRQGEDIAKMLCGQLGINEQIPYLKREEQTIPRITHALYKKKYLVPGRGVVLKIYSTDENYLTLMNVFNHIGARQNRADFDRIVQNYSLKGENAALGVVPMSILTAHAPSGKGWMAIEDMKIKNMPIVEGVEVLVQSGVIEKSEDGSKVRLVIRFTAIEEPVAASEPVVEKKPEPVKAPAAVPESSPTVQRVAPESWEGQPCPRCGIGVMKKRKGPRGYFWGCSKYPQCTCTRDIFSKPD